MGFQKGINLVKRQPHNAVKRAIYAVNFAHTNLLLNTVSSRFVERLAVLNVVIYLKIR